MKPYSERKIIAIDFDGCLCENDWPRIGAPNWNVILRVKKRTSLWSKAYLVDVPS